VICNPYPGHRSSPDAAQSAPPTTMGAIGRSYSSVKNTSMAHVGGPNAGSRLTAEMQANVTS
jgi:hypothetical protein